MVCDLLNTLFVNDVNKNILLFNFLITFFTHLRQIYVTHSILHTSHIKSSSDTILN